MSRNAGTLDSWRAFVDHGPRRVALLADEELDRLTEADPVTLR
jgi:hypothetical protein